MVDILVLRDPKMPHTISMKNGRLYYRNKKILAQSLKTIDLTYIALRCRLNLQVFNFARIFSCCRFLCFISVGLKNKMFENFISVQIPAQQGTSYLYQGHTQFQSPVITPRLMPYALGDVHVPSTLSSQIVFTIKMPVLNINSLK